jgi:hypothetical protein
MTAAAEFRIFLNIRIIPYGEDYADNAYDEQDRDEDGLFSQSQSAIKFFKEIFEEFDHTVEVSMMYDSTHIP